MIKYKNIEGYEGRHLAGSDGLIYPLRKKKSKPAPFPVYSRLGQDGYWQAKLQKEGKINHKKVHTLICRAFHGPKPAPDYQVRHLDGNKDNNSAANLKWGTRLENEADKVAHGTVLRGEKANGVKLSEKKVQEIRQARLRGEKVLSLAEFHGVSTRAIYYVLDRRNWK